MNINTKNIELPLPEASLPDGGSLSAFSLDDLIGRGDPALIWALSREAADFDFLKAQSALIEMKSAEYLYYAGLYWKEFDCSAGTKAILDLGDPEYVYRAGWYWKVFDHAKGLDLLVELKNPKYIYFSGLAWRSFDFRTAQDALVKLESAEFIFYAGAYWKLFDYGSGFGGLLRTGNLEYIYRAGCLWREFDYHRGWQAIESAVEDGEQWRGRAFDHSRWKQGLRRVWNTLCGDPQEKTNTEI